MDKQEYERLVVSCLSSSRRLISVLYRDKEREREFGRQREDYTMVCVRVCSGLGISRSLRILCKGYVHRPSGIPTSHV